MKRVKKTPPVHAKNLVMNSTFNGGVKLDDNALAAVNAIGRAMEAEARAAESRATALKHLASVLHAPTLLNFGS